MRAAAQSSLHLYAGAVDDYSEVLQREPENADAYYGRGGAYMASGELDKAIINFNQAIQRQVEFKDAYYQRGLAYTYKSMDSGKGLHGKWGSPYGEPKYWKAAIADFSMSIAYREDADSYCQRASTYSALGEKEKALADFNKAVQLAPKYVLARLERSEVYDGLGDFKKALADLDMAARLEPKNPDVYISRAAFFERRGDFNRALAESGRALELKPGSTHGLVIRSFEHGQRQQSDLAFAEINKAIRIDQTLADQAGTPLPKALAGKLAYEYGYRGFLYSQTISGTGSQQLGGMARTWLCPRRNETISRGSRHICSGYRIETR